MTTHTQPSNPSFPAGFVPLAGTRRDCDACGNAERVGFEFDYAYQPIVDVETRAVFAHEALVRGPLGESAYSVLSQVNEHNRYRFDQACRVKALKRARELGIQESISINFLPNAIYQPELCIRTTLEAARVHGFPLDRIIFEVTEGERVEDGPWFAKILREYQRCGFRTAIDDFGAGFAGLKLLSDFQPDIIKIDMDLVRGIDTSRPRQAIVRNLARLCQDMGITLIAEGIETAAERDFVHSCGIRLMQGYLFAKPAFKAAAPVDPLAFSVAAKWVLARQRWRARKSPAGVLAICTLIFWAWWWAIAMPASGSIVRSPRAANCVPHPSYASCRAILARANEAVLNGDEHVAVARYRSYFLPCSLFAHSATSQSLNAFTSGVCARASG